ncbi:MAG: hypothetical protein WC551_11215 [Patescibacteria group bacterium]
MALTKFYCRVGLASGDDDGSSWDNAWASLASMIAGIDAALDASTSGVELQIGIEGTNDADNRYAIGGAATVAASNPLKPLVIRSVTAENTYGIVYLSNVATLTFTGRMIVVGIDLVTDYSGTTLAMKQGAIAYRCKASCVNGTGETLSIADSPSGAYLCHIIGQGSGAGYTVYGLRGFCSKCFIETNNIGIVVAAGRGSFLINDNIIKPYDTSRTIGIRRDNGDAYSNINIINNIIYDFDYGINLIEIFADAADTVQPCFIHGNVIVNPSAGDYGIYGTPAMARNHGDFICNNAIYCATGGNEISGDLAPDYPYLHNIILTGDPFVNASANDFRLSVDGDEFDTLIAQGFNIEMQFDIDNLLAGTVLLPKINYPTESNVLTGIEYANGQYTGTASGSGSGRLMRERRHNV